MSQTEATAPQGHATHPLQPSMDTRYPPPYWYTPPPAVDHTPPPNPVVVIAVSLSPQKGETPHGAGVVLKSLHRDKQELDSKGNYEDSTSDDTVTVADFARNIIESVNAGKFLLKVCNRAGEGEAPLPHGSVVKILYGNGYASTVKIQQEGVKKGKGKPSKKSDAETRIVMVGVSVLSDDVDRPTEFTTDISDDVSGFPVLLPDDAIIDHLKGGFVKIVLRTEGVYWLETEHIIIGEESDASSGVAGVGQVEKEQKSHSLEAWVSEANPGFLKKLVITKAATRTSSMAKAAKIEKIEKLSEPPALSLSKTEKKTKSRKRKVVKEPSEGETATQPDQPSKKRMKKTTTADSESQKGLNVKSMNAAAAKSPKKTATADSGSQKGLNVKSMKAAAKSPKKTATADSGNQKGSNVESTNDAAEKPKRRRKKTSGAGSKVEELMKEPNAAKASAKNNNKSAQSPKTGTKKPVPTSPSKAAQKKKSVAATKKTPSKTRGKAENEDSKKLSDSASSTSPAKAINTLKPKKDSPPVATEGTSIKRTGSKKKRADMTEEELIQSRAEEREYRKGLKRKKEAKEKKEKETASAQSDVLV